MTAGVAAQLQSGVSTVFTAQYAFAALKEDGSVVTWGHPSHGGDSSSVTSQLQSGVSRIFYYAGFRSTQTRRLSRHLGNPTHGGDSSGVALAPIGRQPNLLK